MTTRDRNTRLPHQAFSAICGQHPWLRTIGLIVYLSVGSYLLFINGVDW